MKSAHVLLIGGGGREHAIAWKLTQSPKVGKISVAPGNAGTARMSNTLNVPIPATDIGALLIWAREHQPDLTVVGPEAPLAAGIVDTFQTAGLHIYGPTRAAAQIESSKIFAKQLMQRHAIPTAPFEVFDNPRDVLRYMITEGDRRLAIKADGLAAGKGVYITTCAHDAEEAVRQLMVEKTLGEAGSRIVIESLISGYEVSALAFCDGTHAYLMPYAQDHKRAFDNDEGPNTGGMGAIAPFPLPVQDAGLRAEITQRIEETITRAIEALQTEGTPFRGCLFAGLMISDEPPYVNVLEYNCRFGDPETQAILPLLDNDLYDVFMGTTVPQWKSDTHAATVVMASGGYPGEYSTGKPITGLDRVPADVIVFHAGTQIAVDNVVTAGGRVLSVSSTGSSLKTALERVYVGLHSIHFDGAQYRSDIGARA